MRIAVLSLLIASAAGCAFAQAAPPAPPPSEQPDVIGALIDQHGRAPGDEDEPDTAAVRAKGATPDVEPSFSAPRPGAPVIPFAAPPRSERSTPVNIDDTRRTPDAPQDVRALAYDARIRSSFASAESFQGPLDGGWTLSADGQDLYALQLVDRRDRLEGVWRDVRRKGALTASGMIDDLERRESQLVVKFTPTPGGPVTLATLRTSSSGTWTGELLEGGATRVVVLRRTSP